MTKFKEKYRVESTRLRGWDYSRDGYYFVTVCVKGRICLFGKVVDGIMKLNEYGQIVQDCWFDLPKHYKNIRLDAFCVMPNHFHAIIGIDNTVPDTVGLTDVETGLRPVSTATTMVYAQNQSRHGLNEFVRALKSFSARRINELRKSQGTQVWQERFHDRIIRNDEALQMIRHYIRNNPASWPKDKHYL